MGSMGDYDVFADDGHLDLYTAIEAASVVQPQHPGYASTKQLLSEPFAMPPDGLCLYHALTAAANLSAYRAKTAAERAAAAEQLRRQTIQLLSTEGLVSQSSRLSQSGAAGIPPGFTGAIYGWGTPREAPETTPGPGNPLNRFTAKSYSGK